MASNSKNVIMVDVLINYCSLMGRKSYRLAVMKLRTRTILQLAELGYKNVYFRTHHGLIC